MPIDSLRVERNRTAITGDRLDALSSYAALNLYGEAMPQFLFELLPEARIESARELLEDLRSIKTPAEIAGIRRACEVARSAFAQAVLHVKEGATETQVAGAMRAPLMASTDHQRADGFAYCMCGPNASEAYKAYQKSSQRRLQNGDLVLCHCNSFVGGYWTDITRTYSVGQPNDRGKRMVDAILAARQAALNAIRPGVKACDVDSAARGVIARHGFAEQFVHPTGHGCGFAAIDHNARPRLHPKSNEVLKPGMVFNVEPGIYFKGECGMRHCDMVAVAESGAEVLTPF
jgi:Xaa-Pro aminopeptidase